MYICIKSYKQKNSPTRVENDDGFAVRFPIKVKSNTFLSRLDASRGSIYTFVLRHKSICVDDYIYIYIYDFM